MPSRFRTFLGLNKGALITIAVSLIVGAGVVAWNFGLRVDLSRFFAADVGVMTVQCSPSGNVITWTYDSRYNSNSIQRGNFGAKNLPNCADYWCWLPTINYPHQQPTPGNPATYTDTQLQSGVCYQYRIKYRPELPSNSVFCPTGCNVPATPTPTPSPTPTPPSSPTPTPFPTCRNSLQRSFVTNCPGPGQLCVPVESFTYDYARPTALTLNYSVGPQHCSSLRLRVSVDGVETAVSQTLGWPGGPGPTSISGLAIGNVSAGSHHITVQAEGITSGCNAGDILSWAGTLTVNAATDQCAATPTPTPTPTPSPTATVCPAPTPPQCPDGRSPSPQYGQDGCITGWTCPTPSPTPTGTATPSPTATPTSLSCAPASQTVSVNQTADMQAAGGTGAYSWSAPGGTPQSSASGSTYRVSYASPGGYTVLVNDGQSFAQCTVSVTTVPVTPTPTPTFTATPPPSDAGLSLEKTVRNVSRGTQEADQAPASPGETVEFIISVRSTGAGIAYGVRVEDTLPAGLTFVNGSASIDGQIQPSMTSPLFPPVDMPPGSQKTFRFSALVGANAGSTGQNVDVTNIAYATAPGTGTQDSDTAVVTIVRVAGGTPPPVVQVPTGPGEASVLALVVAAIVTLLYVGYTSTDTFRRREAGGIAGKGGGHPDFR